MDCGPLLKHGSAMDGKSNDWPPAIPCGQHVRHWASIHEWCGMCPLNLAHNQEASSRPQDAPWLMKMCLNAWWVDANKCFCTYACASDLQYPIHMHAFTKCTKRINISYAVKAFQQTYVCLSSTMACVHVKTQALLWIFIIHHTISQTWSSKSHATFCYRDI